MRYYKATFSDGRIAKRGTASREYTHAWRTGSGRAGGFCSSLALAHKAASPSGGEVAPVEEITAAEYRNVGGTNDQD